MRKKVLLYSLLGLIPICTIAVIWCNNIINNTAKGKLYNNVQSIPYNKVGLLLGTSKHLPTGYPNLYYTYRIEAAASLLKAGKIKYLIISGDNSRKEYSEPEDMRADLMAAGIDSAAIFLDYAGFRTFDSMVRLKEIFSQDSVTIISQQFHNERALYMASKEGISAVAFNAADVQARQGIRVQIREKLARVKVFVDYWFGKKPKFLGDKVPIPA
ncbi:MULTISPECIES: SanA/YdcF family protein [Niastella]|uniref:YdcF family protein n=1 Tax=Niastella soli TaxID=2821487 RepID=A0ABS3Z4P7_9BACT|nr:ElyC/SanA/YdcF family protein [Niastella soli]MBO9205142.1 YdcF family protein [Niastella soli]